MSKPFPSFLSRYFRNAAMHATTYTLLATVVLFLFFFILRSELQKSLIKDSQYRAEQWYSTLAAYQPFTEQFCTQVQSMSVMGQVFEVQQGENRSNPWRLKLLCNEMNLNSKAVFSFDSEETREMSADIRDALATGFGAIHVKIKGESWLFASFRYSEKILARSAIKLDALDNEVSKIDSRAAGAILIFLGIIWSGLFFGFSFSLRRQKQVLDKVTSHVPPSQGVRRDDFFSDQEEVDEDHWETVERQVGKLNQEIDRKESILFKQQLEFSELLSAINDGILLVSHNERIRLYNQSFLELFEIEAAQTRQQGVKPMLREWIRHPEILHAFDALKNKEAPSRLEVPIEISNRTFSQKLRLTLKLVKLSLTRTPGVPMRDSFENKNRYLFVFSKPAEEFQGVESAEKQKEWVVNISHELRTPLTVIKGYADLLVSEPDLVMTEIAKEATKGIQNNADRMLRLVKQVLSFEDLRSREPDNSIPRDETSASAHAGPSFTPSLEKSSSRGMQTERVNIDEIFDDALGAVERLRRARNLTISRKTEGAPFFISKSIRSFESPDATLGSSTSLLTQIVVNLLENAIRYFPSAPFRAPPEGRSHIEIESYLKSEKGAQSEVILKVRDFGNGIPEEFHSRIFDRFFRVDRGRTKEMGGSGLGLAIVKEYLSKIGGSISVKNLTAESGSTIGIEFEVRLVIQEEKTS